MLIDTFHEAEAFVRKNHPNELATVNQFLQTNPEWIGKQDFLRQYTHVVYCSGFKYSVVVKRWADIEHAWLGFDPYGIRDHTDWCKKEASKIINHKGKIKAIAETSVWLTKITGTYLTQFILDAQKKIDLFKRLGYIGDITKYHLGICMGFDVIKPDVHVQRIADYYEMDPFKMCEELSEQIGLSKRMVDAILWRAAEQGVIHLKGESEE